VEARSPAGRPAAEAGVDRAAGRSPSRLNIGELISASCAVLLIVFMFAFEWYGVDGIPGRSPARTGVVSSENGWHGLSVIRWLMLLTVAAAFAAVAIHARRPSRPAVAATRLAVLLLASLTTVLLCYRVLIVLPSPDRVFDQKLGAYLGLISALGIALGGYESVREQRARTIASRRVSRARNALASNRIAE